ncbi:hypothetical protein [Nocardia concava]|uniref:hypothetical protein n=1 Tax=Nocardia concava TaxID=257281 RepID=UPI0002D3B8D4|nr:hypothetical protein [Nocardia concava]
MTQPIPGFDHVRHIDAEVVTHVTETDLWAIQAAELATDLAELERLGFIEGSDW